MIKKTTDTKTCIAFTETDKAGDVTRVIEFTRDGVIIDEFMQHGAGYYTRETDRMASSDALIIEVIAALAMYDEKDALIDNVISYLAQRVDLTSTDTVADMFPITLFDL